MPTAGLSRAAKIGALIGLALNVLRQLGELYADHGMNVRLEAVLASVVGGAFAGLILGGLAGALFNRVFLRSRA